uniref:Uncharacterized protein n=1 Tax=Fusarium oxysporum (strain Fo5176) TaxID=660025 RepID=A0A0D2XIV1_FUSOF
MMWMDMKKKFYHGTLALDNQTRQRILLRATLVVGAMTVKPMVNNQATLRPISMPRTSTLLSFRNHTGMNSKPDYNSMTVMLLIKKRLMETAPNWMSLRW